MVNSSSSVLSVQDATIGYHLEPVLNQVTFELEEGEVCALVGPNGSGKSTLLKAILREVQIRSGSISLLGRQTSTFPPVQLAQLLAFVPQSEPQNFAFTARQLVMMGRFPFTVGNGDSEEDVKIVNESLIAADCLAFADRAVTELSGGELQRVLIARALAQSPTLLLMDEPSAHLDLQHSLHLIYLIREAAKKGVTVLVAIHDLNLAAQFADRIIVLSDHRIMLDGKPHEVFNDPLLERVFGVRFQRLTANGRTFLAPQ